MKAAADQAEFLNRPLFFVARARRTSGTLAIVPSFHWYFHIAGLGCMCVWPLVAHVLSTFQGEQRQLAIVLSSTFALLVAWAAAYAGKARSDVLVAYAPGGPYPFGPSRPASLESWLPALLVLLCTSVFGLGKILLGVPKSSLHAADALWLYIALLAANVALVIAAATVLHAFELPLLTEAVQRLPDKIRRMAAQGIGRPRYPSETWRHLDDVPQIVRRLGVHELIFRRSHGTSPLAATLSLLVWRMAAVFFPLTSILMLPFILEARGLWSADLKLPLALCVFNWAALALSYYVYAGKKDLATEKIRLGRYRHITLFRAMGLQPEREVISDIYPYFDAQGVRSAAFLFTVVVPLYLTLIGIFP